MGNTEVEAGYREYCDLKNSLANLAIANFRIRFESFRRFAKPVMEGIAQRLVLCHTLIVGLEFRLQAEIPG